MAGVTNTVFRRICRAKGADVLTTEFVSAEGILHRNDGTKYYLEFVEEERPLGVQLFGAEPSVSPRPLARVIDWVQPDFLDLNFGCPVNKVVCKNGGSALLRDCLSFPGGGGGGEGFGSRAGDGKDSHRVGPQFRQCHQTAAILEQSGIQRIAVHGRTKEQGYSGEADWNVIAQVADAVKVPVIGQWRHHERGGCLAPQARNRGCRGDDRSRRHGVAVDF